MKTDAPSLASLAEDFAWGRQFIIWIGSGLSIPAGLISWSQLRTRLEGRLRAVAARKLPNLTEQERLDLVAQIRRVPDPWKAFEILKARLGDADYRQVLTLALNDSGISDPPETLKRIWRNPNVSGVISLNIDNLASRAFASVYHGRQDLSRATGVSLNLGLRYLSAYQPFLVQLHGRIDDESTWVFTEGELAALFRREDYKVFVRSSLAARRVLFVGCSPDDVAVARHFEEIADVTPNLPHHYWFVPSHEIDAARDARMGRMGVNLVEYTVDRTKSIREQNEQHGEALGQLFDFLETYQFREPEPDPINPMAGPSGARLPPDRVQALAPEQARNLLSRYATAILEEPEDRRARSYEHFLEEYGPAIAVASYVQRGPGAQVFGHSVVGDIGEGAFSRVIKATAPDGMTQRAIKLVRNEVRDDPVMLRSFRRGVRSMQILSEQGVSGMVSYDQAYEIPPCVIMPFVDGSNLEDLGRRPSFKFLDEGIPILARVAEIVSAAHLLSERVLHRDLRPSNIMLRSDDAKSIDERVVVLDFDLSWHEGADADSPISPNMTTVLGYLAPEQIANDVAVTARHQKVDTFGLCMTIYYLLQRQHPDFRSRGSKDWQDIRDRLGHSALYGMKWRSFRSRIRRLVHFGTEAEQEFRLDFDVCVRELRLLNILRHRELSDVQAVDADTMPLEAIAEEILASALDIENYEWRSSRGRGRYVGGLGTSIEIEVTEIGGERGVHLASRKQFDGRQSFATVRKYWGERQAEVHSIMIKAGWEGGVSSRVSAQEVSLSFFVPETVIWSSGPKLAGGLREAWKRLDML